MTLDVYADLFDDDLDTLATALNDARVVSNPGERWARNHSRGAEVAQIFRRKGEVGHTQTVPRQGLEP